MVTARERERAHEIEWAIQEANRLESMGAFDQALGWLTQRNRELRAPALEKRLVALRRAAFGRRHSRPSIRVRGDASRGVDRDATCGVPVIGRAGLTAELVRDTLDAHGVLLVRGLFDEPQVERLRSIVDSAFEARRAARAGITDATGGAWFEEVPEIEPLGRRFLGDLGMYICDSPRGLFELLEVYRDAGVLDLVSQYFRERIALMPEKCTLRQVPPNTVEEWDELCAKFGDSEGAELWHQDGRLFGDGVEALDVWATLSPCGREAPGLEVLPSNMRRFLPADNVRAVGTISPVALAEAAPTVKPVLPELRPGDGVFLDQLTVHSTGHRRGMVNDRWSVECWFFGEKAYPTTGEGFLL